MYLLCNYVTIYCVALTLSCSAILNHAESTGSQKTSSIGLPTEYSSSFLYFRDPSKFSPPFGMLYSPKLSSADDSFGDLNFCDNQNTRDHAKGGEFAESCTDTWRLHFINYIIFLLWIFCIYICNCSIGSWGGLKKLIPVGGVPSMSRHPCKQPAWEHWRRQKTWSH